MKLQYKCKLCNLQYNTRTEYNLHKKENHNLEKEFINCVLCNRKLNKLGFGFHVRKAHNITRKEYYDIYIKKNNEGKCLVCNNNTTFVDISIGYLKYCSNKCSNKDPNVIDKKKITCKRNYGYEFPYQSPEIMSKIQRTPLVYDNNNFDSGWELQYYIYLKDHNIKFKYHPGNISYIKNGETKYYHPDFYLIENNQYVEIKGDYLLNLDGNYFNNMSPEKMECMLKNTIILTSKELQEVFRYIRKKYNLSGRKTFLREFKKGNINE